MVRPDYPEVLDRMTRSGVQPLSGRSVTLTVRGQTVCFAGVDDLDGAYQNDPVRYAGALDRATADLSADSYNILLAHRPDAIELYDRYPLDLVLSGHTHGGQVRIPLLLNGLYAPGQGLFPRYAGGQYLVGDTQMIVSRGLSYYPRLPRIFNPPEVVVVDLQKGEPASW